MSDGEFIFVPTASPHSLYVVQAPSAGDPANVRVLPFDILMAGAHASRPAAGNDFSGCLYLETDTDGGTLFRCNGTDWIQTGVGVAGSAFPTGTAGGDLGGTYPDPAVQQAAGAFALAGVLTPATLTTNQDNYNPTGLSSATVLRLSTTTSHDLTGLAGGAAGRLIVISNVGSEDLVLISQSSASTAANRFAFEADLTLGPDQTALLQYDATSSRWRLVASSVSGGGGGIPTSIITAQGDLIAGSAANTPAALAVGAEGEMLVADSGETPGVKWLARLVPLSFIIDGGGAAITSGVKGDVELPFNAFIESARLLADQSGSIVIDLWKDSYANLPPVVGDSITASAKPTLSSAQKSQDTTLSGWTRTVNAGDWLRVNVDSASTVQRVTLSLVLRQLP